MEIVVEPSDGVIEVVVRDGGSGGAAVRPGRGLAGLRDRVAELGGDLGEIEASIAARDTYDSTRADSPLTQADGSTVLDTSGLSIDEVLERIEGLLP